jgi:hypothetical protein
MAQFILRWHPKISFLNHTPNASKTATVLMSGTPQRVSAVTLEAFKRHGSE